MHLRPLTWLLLCFAGPVLGAPAAKKSSSGGKTVGEAAAIEFGLKGLLDLDSDDDTVAYADLTLGYFLLQGFELGLTSLQGTTPSGKRDTNGIFVEFDFVNSTQFMPFTGVAVKHTAPPVDAEDDRDALLGSAFFGNNLVIAPNVALSFTLLFDYADEKVFGDSTERKRRNREANLGLRLYF